MTKSLATFNAIGRIFALVVCLLPALTFGGWFWWGLVAVNAVLFVNWMIIRRHAS